MLRITLLAPAALVSLLLCPPPTAAAKSKPPRVAPNTLERALDIAPIRHLLRVATDSKGRHLAYITRGDRKKLPKKWPTGAMLWYSRDGKEFLTNISSLSARSKAIVTWNFRDPRHIENGRLKTQSVVATEDGGQTLTVRCDERKTPFTALPPDQASAVIARGKFFHPTWNRRSRFLARDDRGVYFFVDNAAYPELSRDYRVYRGMRGSMSHLTLKGVADDSAGQIFSTQRGHLRLIVSTARHNGTGVTKPSRAEWIKGRKRTPLTVLPIWDNLKLIYQELGPYVGQRLGTPCDDL